VNGFCQFCNKLVKKDDYITYILQCKVSTTVNVIYLVVVFALFVFMLVRVPLCFFVADVFRRIKICAKRTMPDYKLTYFQMRARGEVIRMIFAVAGVPYEDHRIEWSEWPALKPSK